MTRVDHSTSGEGRSETGWREGSVATGFMPFCLRMTTRGAATAHNSSPHSPLAPVLITAQSPLPSAGPRVVAALLMLTLGD